MNNHHEDMISQALRVYDRMAFLTQIDPKSERFLRLRKAANRRFRRRSMKWRDEMHALFMSR